MMKFLAFLILFLSSGQDTRAVLTGRGAPGCALEIDGLLDFGAVVAGMAQTRSLALRNASSTHSCEVISADLVKPPASPSGPFPASQFMLETTVAFPLLLPPGAGSIGALIVTYTPSAPVAGAPPGAATEDRAELIVRWRTP